MNNNYHKKTIFFLFILSITQQSFSSDKIKKEYPLNKKYIGKLEAKHGSEKGFFVKILNHENEDKEHFGFIPIKKFTAENHRYVTFGKLAPFIVIGHGLYLPFMTFGKSWE